MIDQRVAACVNSIEQPNAVDNNNLLKFDI